MNISLPLKLKRFVESRVRSGMYGNASDVIRAGLRALAREESAPNLRQFEEIMAALPQEPITPEIEQDIERRIRAARAAERSKGRR